MATKSVKTYRDQTQNFFSTLVPTRRLLRSGMQAGKHQLRKKYADVLVSNNKAITTLETFQWNSQKELSMDKDLYEQWVKIFQVSEKMCFAQEKDMQTVSGIKANSVRLQNLFKDKELFFLVAGVFQVFNKGTINRVVGASDWTVLTAQIVKDGNQHTSRIVLNEVCRAFEDKTKLSPTKRLLEETEKVLKNTYGVSDVYLFVDDQRPRDLVSGPVTISGKTLKKIYEKYGYVWDGWENANEFRMFKRI